MNLRNSFRLVAFSEGVSYILLLFVAVPIKYLGNNESFVKMLGMPHGILFVLYIAMAFTIRPEQKWSNRTFALVLIASLIPFATFYVDKKYLRTTT
ncbi:DUF3817 domain-containing protein [Sungkyunkwania multivorans]|uniref:DUF3817 domain-containing protein n=1 Tax=Sungkyunkwania multivorans TaxID=1173618 RepID=A0ABW3CXX9_9FLAO